MTETKRMTSNPAFAFVDYRGRGGLATYGDRNDYVGEAVAPATVTAQGVALRCLFYIAILCATGGWIWSQMLPYLTSGTPLPGSLHAFTIGGLIGAFIISMVTIFVPRIAWITGPIYSALEGLFLGSLSVTLEAAYPGIVMNAVLSTVGVFAIVAFFYATGVVKVTETFKTVLLSAMFGICLLYLVNMLFSLFGGQGLSILNQQGNWLAIGLSVLIVIVAGLNFAWDFQNVKDAQDAGAPKYYEAYLAFGLMITLVWLYIELLRLWMLLQRRD